MGKLSPTTPDLAQQVVTGTFTGTTASTSINVVGGFNVAVWGTFSATVAVQKSFDGGTTFIPVLDDTQTPVAFTQSSAFEFSEVELGVLYRLNCGTFVSGTVNYRMSASVPRTTDGW